MLPNVWADQSYPLFIRSIRPIIKISFIFSLHKHGTVSAGPLGSKASGQTQDLWKGSIKILDRWKLIVGLKRFGHKRLLIIWRNYVYLNGPPDWLWWEHENLVLKLDKFDLLTENWAVAEGGGQGNYKMKDKQQNIAHQNVVVSNGYE